jgi:hypothetical protein
MDGLNYVQAYSDDVLIVTRKIYEYHLRKLRTVLQKVHAASLKVDMERYVCYYAVSIFG